MTTDDLKKVLEEHKKWIEDKNGTRAVLSNADLSNVDLCSANLRSADLCGADLCGADLCGADFDETKADFWTIGLRLACPEEGNFVGYKKAADKIVVLEIPADAKRSSATTLKCRCNKAKVLRIENLDGTPAELQAIMTKISFTKLEKSSKFPTLMKIVGTNVVRGYIFSSTAKTLKTGRNNNYERD